MSSLTRRADALRARVSEPKPYPETRDAVEIVGRHSTDAPGSGWSSPADRHALSGYRKLLTVRPFGKIEQPYLTGAYMNLVRLPNRVPEAIQLPQSAARRSQPRNRPTMDEGLCG